MAKKKKKVLFKRPGERVVDLKKHCEMVLKLGKERKLKKAFDELKRVEGQFKSEWRYHATLGAILRLQNDDEGAITAYRKGLELKKDDSTMMHPLGMLLLEQGDVAGVELLEAVVAKNDLESAELEKIKGVLDEVKTTLERLSGDQFKQLKTLNKKGMKLIYEKDYVAGKEVFEKLLTLDPLNDDGELYLGMCLLTSGDKEGAVICFKNILKRTPQHEAANLYLMFAQKGNDSLLEGLKKDLPKFIDAFNESAPPDPKRGFFDC